LGGGGRHKNCYRLFNACASMRPLPLLDPVFYGQSRPHNTDTSKLSSRLCDGWQRGGPSKGRKHAIKHALKPGVASTRPETRVSCQIRGQVSPRAASQGVNKAGASHQIRGQARGQTQRARRVVCSPTDPYLLHINPQTLTSCTSTHRPLPLAHPPAGPRLCAPPHTPEIGSQTWANAPLCARPSTWRHIIIIIIICTLTAQAGLWAA
jgi:hypothetical protein